MDVISWLCDLCLFLLHYDTCLYANVALLITLIVMMLFSCWIPWMMTWLYDYDNVLCDCDCGLLNGSGVAFWHTNLDRLPHSSINMGSVATFQYAKCLGLGSMIGPMTCHNCVFWGNVKLFIVRTCWWYCICSIVACDYMVVLTYICCT